MTGIRLMTIVSAAVALYLAACEHSPESTTDRARDNLKKLSSAREIEADDPEEDLEQTEDDLEGAEEGEASTSSVDLTREVPPAEVQELQLELALRPSGTEALPDVLVYAKLLDERGKEVSSTGDLTLTISRAGSEEVQKTVAMMPKRFLEQDVPGQDTRAFCTFADVIRTEESGSVTVRGSFDSRLENERTIGVDRSPPPAVLH